MSSASPRDERVLLLARLSARLARCPDLDSLVESTLGALDELFGFSHSLLLLVDERGDRLYTIASRGYDAEGVGSEVRMGEGVIGMVAERAESMRVGNLRQMLAYARTVRRVYEARGGEAPSREIPLPGLARAESQVAVPAMVLGQLVGVLAIESETKVAFRVEDEALLGVVATLVASAIEIDWAHERAAADAGMGEVASRPVVTPPSPATTRVRFFTVDGSTFLDGDYLIKGVAGRVLWLLLGHHAREGRIDFTNKEVRLDPSLELPEFRDNLESRLILLKRRLDERDAPIRIDKTGRGRFRLLVDGVLRLEEVETER
ncbi:MAG TPA: GAF domain-containing protein [Acidimicrobiia bacterium]|nr:GAF domain-containing protein [Acidimicrobiia bacterium]